MTTHIASLYSHCMNAIIQILCGSRHESLFPTFVQKLKKENGLFPVFTYLVIEELIKRYPGYVRDDVLQLVTYKNIKSLVVKACDNITCKSLGIVLQRCANIRSLDLSQCNQLMSSNELLHVLRGYGKSLKTLRLDKISVLDDDFLQEILYHCPALEELFCEGCVGLQDSSFLKPTGGNQSFGAHLTVVNVSCCENVTNTFVRHLAEVSGPRLKSVNISWTNADCISLLYLGGYTLSTAVEVAHSTRSLEVHVMKDIELAKELEEEKDKRNKNSNVIDEGLKANSVTSCKSKKLCDYCSSNVTSSTGGLINNVECFEDYDIIEGDTSADSIAHCTSDSVYSDWAILDLNEISVGMNSGICTCHQSIPNQTETTAQTEMDDSSSWNTSPSGIENDKFKKLFVPVSTSLDITDIHFFEFTVGRKCVELFVESNPNLVDLHMSWEEMNNEVLEYIAKNEVNLQNISLVNSEKVTADGVAALALSCKQLKSVDVKGLPFLNDASLIKLIENNPMIRYFGLAESALSDRVLNKISEALANTIRHLDLSWCENITNVGVVSILSRCGKLSYLNLRQCKVSLPTVEAITMHGRTFTDIRLCGISDLNDKTCQSMLRGLPNLRCVDLSWSPCITDDTVELMFNVCPQLRIVTVVGLKLITIKCLLPIVSQHKQWYQTRGINLNSLKGNTVKNEIVEKAFYIPFRSVDYAAELELLSLGYCDKVNDECLSEIVAVCRGTLAIEDYYGEAIKPKWVKAPVTPRINELPG